MRSLVDTPSDVLDGLASRSDPKGLAQLSRHLALLSATSLLVVVAWPSLWVLLAWIVHGCVLVFLFAPLHECTHRTAFESRWMNDRVAGVCGGVLLLPAHYFRGFHLAHHAHTQERERDPELARPKPSTFREYAYHVSGIPYALERMRTIARHCLGQVDEPFIPASHAKIVVREARTLVGIYAGLAAASWWVGSLALLVYWLVPMAIGQPMLRLFLLAEHTQCALSGDPAHNTRTTGCGPFLRRLAWNMPFHREHHLFPSIPFHGLPAASRRLASLLPEPERSYASFHRSLTARLIQR